MESNLRIIISGGGTGDDLSGGFYSQRAQGTAP